MIRLISIYNSLNSIKTIYHDTKNKIEDKVHRVLNHYLLEIKFDDIFDQEMLGARTSVIKNDSQVEISDKTKGLFISQSKNKKEELKDVKELTLIDLPKEILRYILSYLSREDISKMGQVDILLHKITQEPWLISPLIEKSINALDFNTLFRLFPKYGVNFKSLFLNVDNRFKNCDEAILLISFCPHLTTLTINFGNQYPIIESEGETFPIDIQNILNEVNRRQRSFCSLSKDHVEKIFSLQDLHTLNLKNCKFDVQETLHRVPLSLKSIELTNCEMIADHMKHIVPAIKNITSLSLINCTDITNQELSLLAKDITNLESLSIVGSYRLTESCVKSFVQSNKKLTSLSIVEPTTSDSQWISDMIPTLQNLTSLEIKLGNNTLIKMAPHLKKLRAITLSESKHLSIDGLNILAPYMENIEILNLSSCPQICDQTLKAIAPFLSKLKSLDLSNNMITEEGLKAFFQIQRSSLTHLNLNYVYYLNSTWKISGEFLIEQSIDLRNVESLFLRRICLADEAFLKMSESLKKIQHLDLGETHITTTSLESICLLTTLKTLNLDETSISFENLPSYKLSFLKNLSKLSLKCCKQLSDKCLMAIAPFIQELESLNLTKTKITNEGLKAIAPSLKNLKELYLDECPNITNTGLKVIAPYIKNLKNFSVEANPQLSFEGFIPIVSSFSNLETLVLSDLHPGNENNLNEIAPHLRRISNLEICEDHLITKKFLDILYQFE